MNYIKENICVIFYAIVLAFFPFLFAFTASNEDAIIRICINLLYAILFGIVLMANQGIPRKFEAILFGIIAFAPNIIVMSYLLMDKVIMKSADFWVVFNTNPEEAKNLFATLPISVYIWSVVYVLLLTISLVGIFRHEQVSIKIPIWIQFLLIISFVVLSFVNPFRSKVPMVDFYKSFYKYQKEQRDVAEFYANRQSLTLDVERLFPTNQKNTLLIMIGESQNRCHMQLYGYARPTNPQLMEIKDELILYNDVCSPATQTLLSMKQILTFANYEQPDMYKREANIIELLRFGGYKTFWFDNQDETRNGAFAIDTYTPTSYRTMAKQSDEYSDSGVFDSILITKLQHALLDTTQNKAIFLHLIGSHFEYAQRYEPSFEYFKDTIGIVSPYRDELTQKDIDVINAYDNSNRYTDYIVRSCIELLRADGGRSAMLYFSDHGEEVFDYQYYYRRSFDKISPAMCEPSFFLWMNDEYRKASDLEFDPLRPYCTDDVIYSIMDLAGIRYFMYDSTRSVFSPSFRPKERKVLNLNYQSIVEKYSKVE